MIVGTAGHIDHGKTALIKRLTGIDTDRLPEEKKRGMTIELGFAHGSLDGIGPIGIIDVPGHERFIRTMVAGATGIDLALLVVAADDGVMPQTREHLDIVGLLGIERAVVALSKTDLADGGRVAAVRDEIKALLDGTPLTGAPIVPVSARSGDGIEALRRALAGGARAVRAKSIAGPFWLAIDRVFTASGFGSVVTGTIASGRVAVGDALRLLPEGRAVRVRGVQVHGQAVEAATAGSRCALNLAGVDKQVLKRGMAVCDPGLTRAARVIDARVSLIGDDRAKPLKSHSAVRFHSGAAETTARLQWLESPPGPGGGGPAQIRLEAETPLLAGHRFIIRDAAAQRTIGGGVVLDAFAARRGVRLPERIERLGRLGSGDADDRLAAWLESRGADGWLLPELALHMGATPQIIEDRLKGRDDILREDADGTAWIGLKSAVEALGPRITDALTDYLKENPRATAAPLATLRATVCARLDRRVFRALLGRLADAGQLEITREGVRPMGHRQTFSAADGALADDVVGRLGYGAHGDGPPPKLDALARALRQSPQRLGRFLGALERTGRVVKLAPGVYVTGDDLNRWQGRAEAHLADHGHLGVAEFRDAVGIGRGLAILVLEHLDREGITKRTGDHRVAASPRNDEERRQG